MKFRAHRPESLLRLGSFLRTVSGTTVLVQRDALPEFFSQL